VQGSSLYDIEIGVAKLQPRRWSKVVAECTATSTVLVELLRGELSDSVMRAVTNVETGLFPAPPSCRMSCLLPDGPACASTMAAVLYGVGARLDTRPELLFTLRGVDRASLVAERAAAAISEATTEGKRSRRVLLSSGLSDVFGIEARPAPVQRAARAPAEPPPTKPAASKRSAGPKNPSHGQAPGSLARAAAQELLVSRSVAAAVTSRKTAALILEFVKSHPGVGVELIGQRMGLSTGQLSLPLKELLAIGSIVRSGLRRATKL